jgi:molybdopterin-guanine dinucleotide biosynthesis protein A
MPRATEKTMHHHHDTIAIVLAGGRSRRLAGVVPAGGKASLHVGDDTMLGHVCRVLAGEVGRVIVVAAEGQPLPPLPESVETTRDTQPAHGPLAVIRDGLAYALATGPRPKLAMLCSCDVPGLAAAVVRLLVEKARTEHVSWVVPVVGGHPQVLVSAVAESLVDRLLSDETASIASLRSLLETIAKTHPDEVLWLHEAVLASFDPTLRSFADVDSPEDHANAVASLIVRP